MAKVNTIQTNLTGGELSPRLDGRVDITKFKNGARVLENVTVLPHGGARKRSGTKFVVAQKSSVDDVVLVPFIYNSEQAYVLVFGPSYVWFVKDGGIITHGAGTITGITKANPAVLTYVGSDTYANGDVVIVTGVAGMTEVNNRQFTVANVDTGANTFELSGVDSREYGTYTSGGAVAEIVELTTTYTADQLDELRFAQTNDVLYITHGLHPTRKIGRSSHTSWTLETPTLTTGPFRTINPDTSNRLTPSWTPFAITNATQANPCVITVSTTHNILAGQQVLIDGVVGMTELNGNVYTVNAVGSTTMTLGVDATGFTAYVSGGAALKNPDAFGCHEVGTNLTLTATSSTFASTMVGALFRLWEDGKGTGVQGPQLGENVVIAEGSQYTHAGKVYGISNKSAAPLTWAGFNRVPDFDAGTLRITQGDGQYFDSSFLHPLYCIIRITGYTSATSVTAQIVRYKMPQNVRLFGTISWEEGAWSNYRGYPKTCAFYEQRLFFGGSSSEPTALWSSKSGAYEDFSDGANDDDAIVYRLASGRADVIRWLESGRVLTAGTSNGEFAIAASNQNEALTPSNFKITPQTSYGTSEAPPLRVNQTVLYPQRGGRASNAARKLREFQYQFDQDAFNSTDITVFAEHIFGDGFDRIAYQMEPDSLIFTRRTDGLLASCTYERTQEVVAWHRQRLGGTDAQVKAITCIPGTIGDEIWLSVARTIDGGTVRYIELLQPAFGDDDAKEDAFFVDCGATYSGSATTTITGLWHLRGEAVKINANGSVQTGTVSATGSLTLSRSATKAHIGSGYTAIIETEDFEAGAQAGTAQGRPKRISELHVRFLNSASGTYGPDAAHQRQMTFRTGADVHGTSPPLFSGLHRVDFGAGWEREARVRIEHSDPLPMHVTGIIAELNVVG